ncbi:MAG: MBL fold metallo-hydrolase [Nitrospirae bacterium]|nr:MBL fold metallo-hydrolase [Nitrospirota bacterium]
MKPKPDEVFIRQLELGPMQNFVYLIGCPETHLAAIVDPAWDIEAIIRAAEVAEYRIEHILVTHAHFDHVNGVEPLLELRAARVHVHKSEAGFLKGMTGDLRRTEGGETLTLGRLEITFMHTPGHTKGSQCFLVRNSLVSGDTLFIRNCGRTDLPGGSDEEMYHTMKKLRDLPDQIVLLPGHHYADKPTSTLADEKRENPYLTSATMSDFLKLT